MDNWFTIEQIDRDTFSISEYKHWEETHCYLLCGEKCAILIDTGLGVSNIRKIVDSLTGLEEHPEAAADRSLKILEAGQIEEEDFFCHVTHKTWDAILHDIRKAHENDMESTPDTTPADEMIKEVRKAMQSTGDRVQEFLEIFCKAFQLKYKRLTDEERTTLKRLFKRSPLIKNSGINFRRRPWK